MSKELFQNKYRTQSVRLAKGDYSVGDFFVTICVKDFKCYFGNIVQGEMMLNEFGKIVQQEILNISKIRKHVMIDSFVVMPNHIHLLICIDTPHNIPTNHTSRGALHAPPSNHPRASNGVACNATVHEGGDAPPSNHPRASNGVACNATVHEGGVNTFGPQRNNLASLIRGLKSSITSKIREKSPGFAWLSRFHDHIVRSDAEFLGIREYIEKNPANRDQDGKNI